MPKRFFLLAALLVLSGGCSSSDAPKPSDAGAANPDVAGGKGGGASSGGAGGAAGSGGAPVFTGSGGAGGAQNTTDAKTDLATEKPDASKPLFGGVFVEFVPVDHTRFLGIFYDGQPFEAVLFDLKQEQGDCRLLVPRNVACAPTCGINAVCTGTNTCSPRPNQVNVGVLHVEGLGGMNHDVEPLAPNVLNYQVAASLPFDSCKEGDDIKIGANDFSLAAKCVSPLAVTSTVPIPVTSGQPMRLAWTPPGRPGISRIEIELDISHHAGLKGQIECDVPDSGSFEVPAPLITALVNLGRAGYPTVKVRRISKGVASSQPDVTLTVFVQSELPVDTGVVSCGSGDPPVVCPTGMTCQPGFFCGPMK